MIEVDGLMAAVMPTLNVSPSADAPAEFAAAMALAADAAGQSGIESDGEPQPTVSLAETPLDSEPTLDLDALTDPGPLGEADEVAAAGAAALALALAPGVDAPTAPADSPSSTGEAIGDIGDTAETQDVGVPAPSAAIGGPTLVVADEEAIATVAAPSVAPSAASSAENQHAGAESAGGPAPAVEPRAVPSSEPAAVLDSLGDEPLPATASTPVLVDEAVAPPATTVAAVPTADAADEETPAGESTATDGAVDAPPGPVAAATPVPASAEAQSASAAPAVPSETSAGSDASVLEGVIADAESPNPSPSPLPLADAGADAAVPRPDVATSEPPAPTVQPAAAPAPNARVGAATGVADVVPTPTIPTAEATPTQQVAEALRDVRRLADGSHRLSLQLHPEELGAVQLEVAIRDGQLHVRAVAETDAARAALEQNLPELRSELRDAGVRAGSLEVGPDASGRDGSDPANRGPRAERRGDPADDDPATPIPTHDPSTSSGLDIRL